MRTLLVVGLLFLSFCSKELKAAEMLSINPDEMAKAEINSWRAYYGKDKIELIKSISKMISLQYQIDDPQKWSTIFLRFGLAIYRFSNLKFDTTQEGYEQAVLPDLIRAYKELKATVNANWDPEEVAKYDLEWWIQRRQHDKNDPETVGETMAKLYQQIYGPKDNHHFSRAGFLRASAARYRDLCKMRWKIVSEQDWKVMQNILIESYQELVMGINANRP